MLPQSPPTSPCAPPAPSLVSVVVCTRNRSGSLRRLLQSMARQKLPAGLGWELMLIDNGGTDDTRSVADSFAGVLPIRYVEHPEVGLASARNRALDEARGAYICWTDDDTIVEPGWLASYVEAFARHPDAAIFGGPIAPAIEAGTPRWLLREQHRWPLDCVVGSIDPGREAIPIRRKPWGANWAVRLADCRGERFDTALGWSPSQARVAEETDLIDRMLRGGATGWWVPEARLRHVVRRDRLTWRMIFRNYVARGDTDAYVLNRSPGANWMLDQHSRLVGMKAGAVQARIVWHALRFGFWRLLLQNRRALRALAHCGYYNGFANRWPASRRPVPRLSIASAPPGARERRTIS